MSFLGNIIGSQWGIGVIDKVHRFSTLHGTTSQKGKIPRHVDETIYNFVFSVMILFEVLTMNLSHHNCLNV
jgi:hypothetical protein